jgi:hypothetical protein
LFAALAGGLPVWAATTRETVDSSEVATEVRIGDEGVRVRKRGHAVDEARIGHNRRRATVEVDTGDSTEPIIDIDTDNPNDIVRFGANITVGPGKKIDGDVVAIFGSIDVAGEVMGQVVAVGGDVNVRPSGIIHGGAVAVGGVVNEATGSTITGQNVSVGVGPLRLLSLLGILIGGSVILTFVLYMMLMVVALIVLVLARNRMEGTLEAYDHRMGKCIVYGFLLTLAFVPVLVLLCITIIGIPVAILLPFVYALASLVGVACSGIYLGRRLRPGLTAGWAALLGLGSLVVMGWIGSALSHVPVLGILGAVLHLIAGFGWFWAYLAGLGAIWLTRFGNPKRVARLRGETPSAASTVVPPPPAPPDESVTSTWVPPDPIPPLPQLPPTPDITPPAS